MEEEKKQNTDQEKKSNIWLVILIIVFFILDIFALFSFIFWSNVGKILVVAKPIIYLYPEKDEEIEVYLGYKDKITTSYPKYINGWKVLAKPNGDLKDLKTNKSLYSLYYESENAHEFKVEKEGFCIEGEKTAEFLEKELAKLGLTEREAEEFIIYWLPRLEKNKYNYIRFATREEINKNMPLEITPKPDTEIRVLMVFKGLNNKIDVKEQQVITPKRDGFVAVEWGGVEI